MSDDIGVHTSPHRHQVDMCSCVGVHIWCHCREVHMFVDVGVDIVVDMHRVIRCRQKENVKVGMEGCMCVTMYFVGRGRRTYVVRVG